MTRRLATTSDKSNDIAARRAGARRLHLNDVADSVDDVVQRRAGQPHHHNDVLRAVSATRM